MSETSKKGLFCSKL